MSIQAHARALYRVAQIGNQLEELASEIQCTGTSHELFKLYTQTRDLHTELWHAYLDLKAHEKPKPTHHTNEPPIDWRTNTAPGDVAARDSF